MTTRWPAAEVLNPVLWLGRNASNSIGEPIGSGVVCYVNGNQYLVTALHVIKACDSRPLLRFNAQWNVIDWQTVASDESNDIAVLKTDEWLDAKYDTVQFGVADGLIYGQIGYALGYPAVRDQAGSTTNHILEVRGRPVPIAALVVATFASDNVTYSAAFVNAGFSGGAIVFPIGDKSWTIAGIITHFPTVPRPVFRDGKETGDYILEHTGLVGYTKFKIVESLITAAEATHK